MIRVGFIGFGTFATLRYEILSSFENVSCIGFFDTAKVDTFLGLKQYKDLDELLKLVDSVIISLPPFFAADMVRKCLRQKLHVFCEKPPGVDFRSLAGIDDLSEGLVLAYGFNHRLHSSIQKIKEIVDSQEMGRILWMRGRYGKEVDESYRLSWRCDKTLNGGGILIDQGIHLLDIMDWLAGGFDVTQAILSDSYLGIDKVEDNAFVGLMSSKTGISASLHSTITQWRYLFSLEIFLEEGALILNGLRTRSGRYGDEKLTIKRRGAPGGEDEIIEYPDNESWFREILSFIRAIETSCPYPYANINDAQNIMKLLDNVYKNALWVSRQ